MKPIWWYREKVISGVAATVPLRKKSGGQTDLTSPLGRFLYELARQPDVNSVLEIGTWDGQGSTYCLALGLHETAGKLLTLESNSRMHKKAAAFYHGKGLPVELIFGASIAADEYPPLSQFEVLQADVPLRERWPTWYQQDLAAARSAEHQGVLDDLISRYKSFDAVYLDGGEFTSYADFIKIRDRSTYVILDDCNPKMSIKNVQSREYALHSPQWSVIRDVLDDRNGWCAFKRKS